MKFIFVKGIKIWNCFKYCSACFKGCKNLNAAHCIHWICFVEYNLYGPQFLTAFATLLKFKKFEFGNIDFFCRGICFFCRSRNWSRRWNFFFCRCSFWSSVFWRYKTLYFWSNFVDVFFVAWTVLPWFKHCLYNIQRCKERINNIFCYLNSVGANFIEKIFHFVGKVGNFCKFNGCRVSFESMRSPENFVDGIVIVRVIFYCKDIALKVINHEFSFREVIF